MTKPRGRKKCEHNRQRSQCKDCGGAGICEHNRIRSRCKNCGGAREEEQEEEIRYSYSMIL
jgi:DnaJ-class molecular chaperone